MLTLKTGDLRLGDVVQCFDGPWGTAIVKQIAMGNVYLWRPYGTCEEWTYTGGVICYTGLEEFSRPVSDTSTWQVWRRASDTSPLDDRRGALASPLGEKQQHAPPASSLLAVMREGD